jgi:integrase
MTFKSVRLSVGLESHQIAAMRNRDYWRDDWESICDDRTLFGIRLADDDWEFPRALAPRAVGSKLVVSFRARLPEGLLDSEVEAYVRRMKRLARVYASFAADVVSTRRSTARHDSRRRKSLSVHSVASHLRCMLRIASALSERWIHDHGDCPDGPRIFSLDRRAFETAFPSPSSVIRTVMDRLHDLGRIGLIDDAPAFFLGRTAGGWQSGNSEVRPPRSKDQNVYTPLPDRTLTRVLGASIYYSNLSSQTVAVFQELSCVSGPKVSARRKEHFQKLARAGGPLFSDLRYPFRFGKQPLLKLEDVGASAVPKLLTLIQAFHLTIIAFCTGMRPGELDTLKRKALRQARWGFIMEGAVTKQSDQLEGTPRDWPLPDRAVEAFHRQCQIADALDPGGESLWVPVTGYDVAQTTVPFTERLPDLLGKLVSDDPETAQELERVHTYRFRPTVARLVALSVQGGAHAVSTVFGHRDIEQTMGYYRARGDFEEELTQAMKDVARALGEEILKDFEGGDAPALTKAYVGRLLGAATEAAGAPVDGYRALGTESLNEAKQMLGEAAHVVRPGVLCTARGSFRGACSSRPDEREPANCVSSCRFRLELSESLRERASRAEWHLEQLATLDSSDVFRVHFSRSALIDAIAGFEGPLARYKDDPRVLAIVERISPSEVVHLSDTARRTIVSISGGRDA